MRGCDKGSTWNCSMTSNASRMWVMPAYVLALAACGSEPPPPPEAPARRPPEPACAQARTELGQQGRGGRLLFEETGEAMMEHESWIRMSDAQRDALVGRLAVIAACNAPEPVSEVEITIRSESGSVITERRVTPSTDFRVTE